MDQNKVNLLAQRFLDAMVMESPMTPDDISRAGALALVSMAKRTTNPMRVMSLFKKSFLELMKK